MSKDHWARDSYEDWHYFNLSLLPQSIDRDKRAHNHWFFIAQTQTRGALEVVVSDEDIVVRVENQPIYPLPYPNSSGYHGLPT